MTTTRDRIIAVEQLRIAVGLLRSANFHTMGAAVPLETIVAVERGQLDLMTEVKQ